MNNDRYEICFSGSGGQGIITAAIVLAEAVGVYEGKNVCQTQSYGPEARGGTSKAGVIISSEFIDYPNVIKPDLLLAMNQASCDAYFPSLKNEGLLIVDSGLVNQIPTNRDVSIPFTGRPISGLPSTASAFPCPPGARLSSVAAIPRWG